MSKRPNFLIFMSDHMNADVVNGNSCYMPNAKKLAKEGVLFKNAYCPTPHCCPSRATFLQEYIQANMVFIIMCLIQLLYIQN